MMSLRSRFLLIVLLASVVPLALVGLWLTRSTVRSGEQFVEDRLAGALDGTVALISTQWVQLRSKLLFVAEDPAVQAMVSRNPQRGTQAESVLRMHLQTLPPSVLRLEVLDIDGASRGGAPLGGDRSTRDSLTTRLGSTPLETELPIFERVSGRRLGTLGFSIAPSALVPSDLLPPVTAGMMVTIVDVKGRSLLPLPMDLDVMDGPKFSWAGDEWVVRRRQLEEPPIGIVVAATLGPFVAPFQRTARRGTMALLAVALVALLSTGVLTSRLTRSLRDLAMAAEAVSQGDLERRIGSNRSDEIGLVAGAFDRMTLQLRQTLDRLAGRESLAAVGEFAAGLAHEVRNPLTAVQVDLQFVESKLPPASVLREPQSKALAEIRRLEATVRDALKVARSGKIRSRPIDLHAPLMAAADAARPAYEHHGATLSLALPPEVIPLMGDPDALEQLFLNLFRNAAEAMEVGGTTTVTLTERSSHCIVRVLDDGGGMPADVLARAFEPLFSTHKEGTGLGLPIAQRIAVAHGGSIRIESTPGRGTTVEVLLPVVADDLRGSGAPL